MYEGILRFAAISFSSSWEAQLFCGIFSMATVTISVSELDSANNFWAAESWTVTACFTQFLNISIFEQTFHKVV